MASYNRVVLVGNMTRDVELRTIQSGKSVAEIGLAVNERRPDPNGSGWIEEANFFDVTVWGRNAEVLRDYTRKGSSILVEGRLKQDTWEQDGQKRSKVKVVADRVLLLGSRGGGGDDGGYSQGGGYRSGGGYSQSGARSGGAGGYSAQRSRGGYSDSSSAPSGGSYGGYPDSSSASGGSYGGDAGGFDSDPGDDIPF